MEVVCVEYGVCMCVGEDFAMCFCVFLFLFFVAFF
jgi:hypothetical protein